jgi:hypothetical protein
MYENETNASVDGSVPGTNTIGTTNALPNEVVAHHLGQLVLGVLQLSPAPNAPSTLPTPALAAATALVIVRGSRCVVPVVSNAAVAWIPCVRPCVRTRGE